MAVPTSLCLKEALWNLSQHRDMGSNVLFEEAQIHVDSPLTEDPGVSYR